MRYSIEINGSEYQNFEKTDGKNSQVVFGTLDARIHEGSERAGWAVESARRFNVPLIDGTRSDPLTGVAGASKAVAEGPMCQIWECPCIPIWGPSPFPGRKDKPIIPYSWENCDGECHQAFGGCI